MPETPASAPTAAPLSGADLLARIKPRFREESTQICLRPDLLDEWEKANADLNEAQTEDARKGRLGTGVSQTTKALAKRVHDIETEIDATAVMFRFRAMSKDRWQAICDNHPPREDNQIDLFAGYNRDAVTDAAVRECLYDPVFEDCTGIKPGTKDQLCDHEDCGTWQQFVKKVNPSEWKELRDTVNSANRSVVDAPKSALASSILSRHGSASRRRATGA